MFIFEYVKYSKKQTIITQPENHRNVVQIPLSVVTSSMPNDISQTIVAIPSSLFRI